MPFDAAALLVHVDNMHIIITRRTIDHTASRRQVDQNPLPFSFIRIQHKTFPVP
jgi:hypothetical protein